MLKNNKAYIILAILFISLVLFEYYGPKEPDWSLSFSKNDKIPFGDYIAFDLLPDAFPESKIHINNKSIYHLDNDIDFANSTLIFNNKNFNISQPALEKLLDFAQKGGKVFISSEKFAEKFADTLNIKTKINWNFIVNKDSLQINFVHPKLKVDSGYYMRKQSYEIYFLNDDNFRNEIIGIFKNEKYINFIKIPYGKGAIFLHTVPFAFTNYNILIDNNAEYIFKIYSYLKNTHIYWDEFYKPEKELANNNRKSTSLLFFIERSAPLKQAYNLLWLMAILFLLFYAKRKQQPIPEIKPPQNASLEFAATLANLYLNQNNHKDILLKRYLYWTDFLREKYYLSFESINSKDAVDIISQKTGAEKKCIQAIIRRYNFALKQETTNAENLLNFNKLLEKFYKTRL